MKNVPSYLQEVLTNKAGKNLFGEPRLLLVWGGDPIKRENCPDQYLGPGFECWCLMLCREAEELGPPELWPRDLGPYPNRGLYMIVQAFQYSGNRLDLDNPIFSPQRFSLIAETIMDNIEVTLETRDRILRDHLSRNQQKLVDQIEAACRNAYPIGDALSYSGQKNCNSAVQQKMDEINKWIKIHGLARLQSFKPGFYTQVDDTHRVIVDAQ